MSVETKQTISSLRANPIFLKIMQLQFKCPWNSGYMTLSRWSQATQSSRHSPFRLSGGYLSIYVISILNYFSWSVDTRPMLTLILTQIALEPGGTGLFKEFGSKNCSGARWLNPVSLSWTQPWLSSAWVSLVVSIAGLLHQANHTPLGNEPGAHPNLLQGMVSTYKAQIPKETPDFGCAVGLQVSLSYVHLENELGEAGK